MTIKSFCVATSIGNLLSETERETEIEAIEAAKEMLAEKSGFKKLFVVQFLKVVELAEPPILIRELEEQDNK